MVRCVGRKFQLERSGARRVSAAQHGRYRDYAQPLFPIAWDPALIELRSRSTATRNRQEIGSMFTRHQTLLLAALTLAALLGAAPAGAQDAQHKRSTETTGSAIAAGVPPAPVGHRQPRVSDIPADTQPTPTEAQQLQRDRELDKKLWICRGC
jgi:hypothetical protein